MGFFALPNILVFQILLPLVSPFIDIMFVAGVIQYLIDRHFHPEAASAASFEKLLTYFLAFLLIDFMTSVLAFSWNAASRKPGRLVVAASRVAAAFLLSADVFDCAVPDAEAGG